MDKNKKIQKYADKYDKLNTEEVTLAISIEKHFPDKLLKCGIDKLFRIWNKKRELLEEMAKNGYYVEDIYELWEQEEAAKECSQK